MKIGLTRKYIEALDVAQAIIDEGDTSVTMEQAEGWPASDLYDWLTAWDYEWNGHRWVLSDEAYE